MTYAQYATKYRAGERTIKRWAAKGAPLNDESAMVEWAKAQTNLPNGFLEWLDERKQPTGPDADDPDWTEFEKIVRSEDPKGAMEKIARARDFASFKFEKAAKANNRKDQKHFADLLGKMESCLHDAQLRAKKLGIDAGELLPRPEVERLVWAIMYWLLRSTDNHLDALTTKLQALSPGLPAEAVRGILDAELISARCLIPFARASKIRSGVSVPDWVVQKMRVTAGDFIENGEASFTQINAS